MQCGAGGVAGGGLLRVRGVRGTDDRPGVWRPGRSCGTECRVRVDEALKRSSSGTPRADEARGGAGGPGRDAHSHLHIITPFITPFVTPFIT